MKVPYVCPEAFREQALPLQGAVLHDLPQLPGLF